MKLRERKLLEKVHECRKFIFANFTPHNPADVMGLSYLRTCMYRASKLDTTTEFLINMQNKKFRDLAYYDNDSYESLMFEYEDGLKELMETLEEKKEEYERRSEEYDKRFSNQNN